MAQWLSAFGSGHDSRVLGWSSTSGSLLSKESASPSPSAAPPACALSNKILKKKKKIKRCSTGEAGVPRKLGSSPGWAPAVWPSGPHGSLLPPTLCRQPLVMGWGVMKLYLYPPCDASDRLVSPCSYFVSRRDPEIHDRPTL